MLFWNKVLPALLMPGTIALVLIAVALCWRWRGQRYARWFGLAGLVLFYLAANPWVANRLADLHAADFPTPAVASAPVADAVYPLGGIVDIPQDGSAELGVNGNIDRLEEALALYRAGKADRIILSQVALGSPPPGMPTTGEFLRARLVDRGLSPAVCVLTDGVLNTRAEAAETARLAALHGWTRILLVTTDTHMPRAYCLFRKTLPPEIEVVAWPVTQTRVFIHTWVNALLPSGWGLALTEEVARERLGLLYYRCF